MTRRTTNPEKEHREIAKLRITQAFANIRFNTDLQDAYDKLCDALDHLEALGVKDVNDKRHHGFYHSPNL